MSEETRPDLLPEGWGTRHRSRAAGAEQVERQVPVLTEVLEIEALVLAQPSPDVQPEVQVAGAADGIASGGPLSDEHGGAGPATELLGTLEQGGEEGISQPVEAAGTDAPMPDVQSDGSASELDIESSQSGSATSFAEHLDELLSELDLASSLPPPSSRLHDATEAPHSGASAERGDQFLAALDGLHGELGTAVPDAPSIELVLAEDIETDGRPAEAGPVASVAGPDLALQSLAVDEAIEPHFGAIEVHDEALLDRLVTQALVPALEETLVRLTPLIADELRASLRSQFARLLADQRARSGD